MYFTVPPPPFRSYNILAVNLPPPPKSHACVHRKGINKLIVFYDKRQNLNSNYVEIQCEKVALNVIN